MKYYLLVLFYLMMLLILVGCAGTPAPQEVKAESIDTVSQVSNVITNEIEPWLLGVIILLAGWAIPTPGAMIRGMFGFIADIFKLFRR